MTTPALPSTLAGSRQAVQPEIDSISKNAVDPSTAPMGLLSPPGETQDELDVRMEGIMQTTKKGDGRGDGMLQAYSDYRKSRGEEPFSYLERGKIKQSNKEYDAKLPFFATMFTDGFESAFPEKDRPAVAASMDSTPDPKMARTVTANKMLVSSMTGVPADKLEGNWDVARTNYAKSALGYDQPGVITDQEFYSLAGAKLRGEQKDRQDSNTYAIRARAAVAAGRPLSEVLTGVDNPEYQKVVRSVYADTLRTYDDSEIMLANKLYERDVAQAQGQYTKPNEENKAATESVSLEKQFSQLPVEKRDRVRTLMAYRMQEDGYDVRGFFQKTYSATEAGADRIGFGVKSSLSGGSAEAIQKVIDLGYSTVPVDQLLRPDQLVPQSMAIMDRETSRAKSGLSKDEFWKNMHKLTPEDVTKLNAAKTEFAAKQDYNGDMATAGLRIARHLDEEHDGFWMRATLQAYGSLPEMGLAIAPMGAGLPILFASKRAEARSNYQRSAPGASASVIDGMANTAALGQTATLAMESFIMGARLPRVGAVLTNMEHGLANFTARGGWRAVAGVVPRAAGVVAFEQVQENTEDIVPDLVQGITSAFAKDVPGVDLKKVYDRQKAIQGDIFGASLIFGIFAGTGRAIGDYVSAPKVKLALQDTQGMRLTGIPAERAMEISALAETRPVDAAQMYQDTFNGLSDETLTANSRAEAARLQQRAAEAEALRSSFLPEIQQREDGKAVVQWNNLTMDQDIFDTPEQAAEAITNREREEDVDISRFNRAEMESLTNQEVTRVADGLPNEIRVDAKWSKPKTLADWAGTSEQRISQARERIRFHLRNASNNMGLVIDDNSPEMRLEDYFIEGSSRNTTVKGMTEIAVELSKGETGSKAPTATPLTAIEEIAEGVSKHLRANGVKIERQIQWVRTVEQETGNSFIPGDVTGFAPEALAQNVDEALSKIAKAYAVGRVTEDQVPSGLLSYLKAFKLWLREVLTLAKDIRALRADGKIDADFQQYLDLATGFSEDQSVSRDNTEARQSVQDEFTTGQTFSIEYKRKQPLDESLIGLSGKTATVKVNGVDRTFGAFPTARLTAEEYMKSAGLFYNPPTTYARVNKDRAKRIAEAYDKMEHAPNDPLVKIAYQAMIDETVDQYKAIMKTGLKVEAINFKRDGDPYEASPRLAIMDVIDNNHLWFFRTADGFGSSEMDVNDNPLLQNTGLKLDDGTELLANDVFRIVHDYFGHIKEGVGFRADGEENAWRMHSAMYSPLARLAMTSETRGQNSWVNFGPHGEANQKAGAGETVFADQKTGLLPEWIAYEGAGDVFESQTFAIQAYHGTPHLFDEFNTEFIGSGDGAQAYGWGLYLAQQKLVADGYAERLGAPASPRNIRVGGIWIVKNGEPIDYSPYEFTQKPGPDDYARATVQEDLLIYQWQWMDAWTKHGEAGLVEEIRKNLLDRIDIAEREDTDLVKSYKKMLATLDSESTVLNKFEVDPGENFLYDVTLNFDKEDVLHFDAKWENQPKKVRDILTNAGVMKRYKENMSDFSTPQNSRDRSKTGRAIYSFLEYEQGSDKDASEYLMKLGIPATSHLDGLSRDKKRGGTRNFVVFDGKSINNYTRNGEKIELDSSPTFAITSGSPIIDVIDGMIRSPEAKATIWKRMRDRVQAIHDHYAKSFETPPPSWMTPADQEVALATLDEERGNEIDRFAEERLKIRGEREKAAGDARTKMMEEMGVTFEDANPQQRRALKRFERESVKLVESQAANKMEVAKAKHLRNMAELDTKEKDILRAGQSADVKASRFRQLNDIAVLQEIAKALPAEIRGKTFSSVDEKGRASRANIIDGFKKLSEMPSAEKRQEYLIDLLGKVEKGIETHLVNQYKKAIEKKMAQAAPKVSDSRTAMGKIGPEGHDVITAIKQAMGMTADEADAIANSIQAQMSTGSMSMDELQQLDSQQAALELFYDYEHADSARLEQAAEFLNDIYTEGRKAWLEVLNGRQLRTAYVVDTFARGLGREGSVTTSMRAETNDANKGFLKRLDEMLMGGFLSGHQTIRRIGELTNDPEVKALLGEMEQAFAEAEIIEAESNKHDNEQLSMAMRSIFKVSTDYALAKKLHELSESNGNVPVTKIEGAFKGVEIKVPLKYADSIVRGDISGWTPKRRENQISDPVEVTLTEDQINLLESALADYEKLSEEDQKVIRSLTITQPGSDGERSSLGPITQLEGLQFLLTMNQPDQAETLDEIGWDAQTKDELMKWLKPEVQAFGQWMVGYLKSEQGSIDAIHRSEKGIGLGLVENYFPVRKEVAKADLSNLDLNGMAPSSVGRSTGFIKARVENKADMALANAIGVFLAHRAQVNFWKSHVGAIREWGSVIGSERFASSVRSSMGDAYYRSLTRLMKRIEGGGRLAAQQQLDFENVVKGMMRGFATATLGGRVSTLLVNTSAALNVAYEMPAQDLMKGLAMLIKRPAAFKDAWNSPAIRRRIEDGGSFEAQLAKAKGISSNPVLSVLTNLSQPAMNAINVVDTLATTSTAAVVWEYTRNQGVRNGLSEDEARVTADEKVDVVLRRTAQPTFRLSKSEFELKALENPISALFALFVSDPRKNIAITYMAGRQLMTGKGTYSTGMAIQQVAMGLVISVAAEYALRASYAAFAKSKPDEEDEFLKRLSSRLSDGKAWGYKLTTGHLTAVPVLGAVWDGAMSKVWGQPAFSSGNNPGVRAVQNIAEIKDVVDSKKTTGDRIEGALHVTQGLGAAIPGGPLAAQFANALDFMKGAAESNGVNLSDADMVKRYKSRYQSASKKLDEIYGTKLEDKKKIREKYNAQVDVLKTMLAPLTPTQRKKVLDEMPVSKDMVKKRITMQLGGSPE